MNSLVHRAPIRYRHFGQELVWQGCCRARQEGSRCSIGILWDAIALLRLGILVLFPSILQGEIARLSYACSD